MEEIGEEPAAGTRSNLWYETNGQASQDWPSFSNHQQDCHERISLLPSRRSDLSNLCQLN